MTKIKETSTNSENKNKLEESCAEIYAINLIRGQWVLSICYYLKYERLRFSDLKNRIPNITDRMLTLQLKRMEENKLLVRHAYAEVPPRVEYELSEIAKQLLPLVKQLEVWGNLHKNYASKD